MNENKFDGKGNIYNKFRPEYPGEMFNYLKKANIITTDTVAADIGAGTGIFSEQLAKAAKYVYAVEPNPDMQNSCRTRLEKYNNAAIVIGNAENTTLGDNSVDIVTAAQTFHWFDPGLFTAECRRVLKPNGNIILVWNVRTVSDGNISAILYDINQKYCPNFNGFTAGIEFSDTGRFSSFFDGEFKLKKFNNDMLYTADEFIGRNLSSSYAPTESDTAFQPYIAALKELFEVKQKNGKLVYPYTTYCYIGKVFK